MNEHGFTKENLLRSLPSALSKDPKMLALAESISQLLVLRREEIEALAIYPHIDRLGEELLDILAYDFKVDWWDSDYGLEEKRRTLGTSWQVHKTLGTKAAVVKAITSVYPQAVVEEWFEYGGEPYHFRLTVRLSESGWDSSKHRQLIEKMRYYKNLRSHRDAIKYYLPLVTVENTERLWLEQVLIKGRFPENPRNLDFFSLWMAWQVQNRNTQLHHLLARFRTAQGNPAALYRLLLEHIWVRGRLPPNRQNLAGTELALGWSGVQRYKTAGAFLARLEAENPGQFTAHRLYMGRYRVDVMGLEAAHFDGVYRFDAERFFWYTFKRRPAFYSMNLRAGVRHRGKASGILLLNPHGAARNPGKGRLRGMYRARDRTGSRPAGGLLLRAEAEHPKRMAERGLRLGVFRARLIGSGKTAGSYKFRVQTGARIQEERLDISAGARNTNTGTVFLTTDSMWLFNAAHSFGGEKRFNAKLERSEI